MPFYTEDSFCEYDHHQHLRSSVGIGPKVTKAIDKATKEWLDNHPEAMLPDRVVTTSKLDDNAVTTEKIEDEAVTEDKIKDDAVTEGKIAPKSVTAEKLADDAIPTMSTSVRGIAKVGSGLSVVEDTLELDGGDISSAVNSWLDNHPEATTTVQDGSIKLSSFSDATINQLQLSTSTIVETIEESMKSIPSPKNGNSLILSDEADNVLLRESDMVLSGDFALDGHPGLSIADEDGNVIVEFHQGLVNNLAGKTFSIIGDSISTYSDYIPSGYGTYYPRGNVDDVSKTWWKVLERSTGMQLLKTASWSGSRVTGDSQDSSGATGCSDARVAAIIGDNGEIPDIIIVFMGTNDISNSSITIGDIPALNVRPNDGVITTIADAYLLLLYKLYAAYPTSHVFCATVLPRRQSESDVSFYTNPTTGSTVEALNKVIRTEANAMNCGIIDFATCGLNVWGMESYFIDSRLHPNVAGMKVMAKTVRKAIEQQFNL